MRPASRRRKHQSKRRARRARRQRSRPPEEARRRLPRRPRLRASGESTREASIRTSPRRRLLSVDALAERVDQVVASSLGQLNGSVEQFVDEALERHLREIVEARVRERLATGEPALADEPDSLVKAPVEPRPEQTKVCNGCRRTLPSTAFQQGRATCRVCRQQQHRERQARKAQELQPGPTADAEPPRNDRTDT
jgi:hypothetical protein